MVSRLPHISPHTYVSVHPLWQLLLFWDFFFVCDFVWEFDKLSTLRVAFKGEIDEYRPWGRRDFYFSKCAVAERVGRNPKQLRSEIQTSRSTFSEQFKCLSFPVCQQLTYFMAYCSAEKMAHFPKNAQENPFPNYLSTCELPFLCFLSFLSNLVSPSLPLSPIIKAINPRSL